MSSRKTSSLIPKTSLQEFLTLSKLPTTSLLHVTTFNYFIFFAVFYWMNIIGSWQYILAPLLETVFRKYILQQECGMLLPFSCSFPFDPTGNWARYIGVYIFETYSSKWGFIVLGELLSFRDASWFIIALFFFVAKPDCICVMFLYCLMLHTLSCHILCTTQYKIFKLIWKIFHKDFFFHLWYCVNYINWYLLCFQMSMNNKNYGPNSVPSYYKFNFVKI